MSWSVTIPNTDADQFVSVVENLELGFTPTYAPTETAEQFAAVKAMIVALFESGALGNVPQFGGYVGGHANEGHTTVPGQASEFISLSLSQVYQQPVPVAPATTTDTVPVTTSTDSSLSNTSGANATTTLGYSATATDSGAIAAQ